VLESCAWDEVIQFSHLTGENLPVLKERRSDEVIILSLKALDKTVKGADLIAGALFKVKLVMPNRHDGARFDIKHASSRETTIETVKLRAQNELV
jgi:hypothetical protein